jgi:DNA polymerase sigma
MGFLNSSLLREYCLFDPLVLDLGLRVKAWAKSNELVDSQCLSSYGWVLLLLFFLIVRVKIVPNLQDCRELPKHRLHEIRGQRLATFWGSSHRFDTRYMSAEVAKSLCPSLAPQPAFSDPVFAAFVRFYAYEFSWSKQSIDIAFPDKALQTRYFDDADNGNKFIALLDPFEHDTRNLAKGVSPGGFQKIKDVFENEAKLYFS